MKKLAAFAAFPVCVFLLGPLLVAQEDSPVAKVVARMNSLDGFRADVGITSSEGGIIRGALSYQGGKMHLALSDGRVIAANGRHLIVYSPSTGVAGKQDMGAGGGGLGWLLSGFETKVRGNAAELTALDPDRGVQKVHLRWSGDYTLQQISIRRKGSEGFLTIQISNLRSVKSFAANVFSWKPPAGSRTVENPLNQKN